MKTYKRTRHRRWKSRKHKRAAYFSVDAVTLRWIKEHGKKLCDNIFKPDPFMKLLGMYDE